MVLILNNLNVDHMVLEIWHPTAVIDNFFSRLLCFRLKWAKTLQLITCKCVLNFQIKKNLSCIGQTKSPKMFLLHGVLSYIIWIVLCIIITCCLTLRLFPRIPHQPISSSDFVEKTFHLSIEEQNWIAT